MIYIYITDGSFIIVTSPENWMLWEPGLHRGAKPNGDLFSMVFHPVTVSGMIHSWLSWLITTLSMIYLWSMAFQPPYNWGIPFL